MSSPPSTPTSPDRDTMTETPYPPADDRLRHLLAQEINTSVDTWKLAFWIAGNIAKSPEIRREMARILSAHTLGRPCGDRNCGHCYDASLNPPAGPAPAADRADLRDRIAAALLARIKLATVSKAQPFDAVTSLFAPNEFDLADTELAVLPASTDRAAVLREAADRYTKLADQNEAYDREQGQLDEAARLQHRTVRDVAVGLRRMADETPQPETQAQPPYHRWNVETRDAVADQWAPGTPITDHDKAVERYQHVTANWPTWKDGTPVERRLVRATTTYTVETQTEPAVVAQPDGEA
jgi:hypothetical protein